MSKSATKKQTPERIGSGVLFSYFGQRLGVAWNIGDYSAALRMAASGS
jgi:hypothetical protein